MTISLNTSFDKPTGVRETNFFIYRTKFGRTLLFCALVLITLLFWFAMLGKETDPVTLSRQLLLLFSGACFGLLFVGMGLFSFSVPTAFDHGKDTKRTFTLDSDSGQLIVKQDGYGDKKHDLSKLKIFDDFFGYFLLYRSRVYFVPKSKAATQFRSQLTTLQKPTK